MVGSGIRKKAIPDPGSQIQGPKGTGSRIPDPDPQQCKIVCNFMMKILRIVEKDFTVI